MDQISLLEECADMVLRGDGGHDVPCIKYYCMVACEVIKNVVEDVPLERDSKNRVIVPFPGVCHLDLAAASQVMHGTKLVRDVTDPDDLQCVLRGLRALGNTTLIVDIVKHMWSILEHTADIATIRPHLDDLLHMPLVRLPVLRRMVLLCPTWDEFSALLGEVSMSVDMATWLLGFLSRFFPSGPLFKRVVHLIPPGVLDPHKALALFEGPKNATFYHPAEAVDAMRELRTMFVTQAWDPSIAVFLGAVVEAMQVFEVVPQSAKHVHGSVVALVGVPTMSLLLHIVGRKAAASRRMAPWVSLSIDWITGAIDARITMDEVGCSARRARRCQIRLTAYDVSGNSKEVWYQLHNLAPQITYSLRDQGQVVAGSLAGFESAVRCVDLSRLRLDLFYAQHSVLDQSIF